MKNFLEVTATKPKLYLLIEIALTPIKQCVCVASINDTIVHDGLLTGPKSILIKHIPIDSPIDIRVVITRQHPEAAIISVSIDDHEVIPLYQNLASPKTNYLNFNGQWQFKIPNFYPWLHTITGQGWIA